MNHELYHYGVLGMRWGVRRYQNKDGSLTAAGKKRYSSMNVVDETSNKHLGDVTVRNGTAESDKIGTAAPNRKPKESSTNMEVFDENTGKYTRTVAVKNGRDFASTMAAARASKMTGLGEELIISAVAYTAIYGTMIAAAKISEKRNRKRKEQELEDLNAGKQIKSFKDAPKLSQKMSPEESAKVTNPEFPSMGTTMNCTFCTTALALRERGYDVKAAKLSDGWFSDQLFAKTFNSPEVKVKAKRTKDVYDALSSHGDGAYGNLVITWQLGGSHSIFWKNENGTTNFYDGQSGKAYKSSSEKNALLNYTSLNYTKYNRLDNCEPTDYALAVVEPNNK